MSRSQADIANLTRAEIRFSVPYSLWLIIEADHASIPDILTPESHTESLAVKMKGAGKKAGSVLSESQKSENAPSALDDSHDTNTPVAAKSKSPNKHSMDYVIRSGIAGGIAGCVVR